MRKKGYLTRHAKSSAALLSIGIHAVLIVVALSFVAVTVIQKDDQIFEAKSVKRPKMALKKLQVPVNIKKKKTQKPKLRKRIVVQPKLNQTMPDIKMPEISGVKGGLGGAAGGGLGGAGGVGFSMPEINLFGVKSKGEKVFIILDSTPFIMADEIGGMTAYAIIKSELVRILKDLNSTILFNIAVYGGGDSICFPNLVPASAENVAKVEKWLAPLNAVSKNMGSMDYGPRTLGSGGVPVRANNQIEPLRGNVAGWSGAGVQAMEQQADVVFLLTRTWGHLAYVVADREQWSASKMLRYKQYVQKARVQHDEENARRAKRGQPPRVLNGDNAVLKAYYPNEEALPGGKVTKPYTVDEIFEALENTRKKYKPTTVARTSGLNRRTKDKDQFSFNVIHFSEESGRALSADQLKKLVNKSGGDYQVIRGLAAIQSYVAGDSEREKPQVTVSNDPVVPDVPAVVPEQVTKSTPDKGATAKLVIDTSEPVANISNPVFVNNVGGGKGVSLGQSFTTGADAFILNEITLVKGSSQSYQSGNSLRLNIFAWNPASEGDDSSNWVLGDGDSLRGTGMTSLLSNQNIELPSGSIAEGSYLHFHLGNPIPLAANTAYGFTVEFIHGGKGANNLNYKQQNSGNVFAGGKKLSVTGSANSTADSADLAFYLK